MVYSSVFNRRKYAPPADYTIRLNGVAAESIVDGPGLRFAVFVQGCPHHCAGCHNPGTHDPGGGYAGSTAELFNDIIKKPAVTGVTFSGGEPFLWARELGELGLALRKAGYDIITFTGFTAEKLLRAADAGGPEKILLAATNILVDGPFVLAQRDLTLKFRGSTNQRVFDITSYPNNSTLRQIEFE